MQGKGRGVLSSEFNRSMIFIIKATILYCNRQLENKIVAIETKSHTHSWYNCSVTYTCVYYL